MTLAAEPWKIDSTSANRGTPPLAISGVCSDSGTCNRAATIQLRKASTTKLSMIVTITSLAPNFALSAPGTAPTRPPPAAAASRQASAAIGHGSPAGSTSPAAAAAKPPAAIWLSAPMLNNPARSGSATASPVQMSVVAL